MRGVGSTAPLAKQQTLQNKKASRQCIHNRPPPVPRPFTPQVKETARRMLTNYTAQATVSDFYTAQRLFKEPGAKALPEVRRSHGLHRVACTDTR
jgi:hypothetical protein